MELHVLRKDGEKTVIRRRVHTQCYYAMVEHAPKTWDGQADSLNKILERFLGEHGPDM